MSYSIIKIYKTNILEDRNMSIDDIEYYLNNYAILYKQINDFQYIKQDKLYNSIKVAINQSELDFVIDFNYVRIENEDSSNGRLCYYFIENVEWKSPNTLQLNLKMDLLNTFKLNTDYTLSNFTKISREHKNRYERVGATSNYRAIVDKYDEGINATKYKDKSKVYPLVEDYGNEGWTLLYKNNNAIDPDKFNQVNPIDTYLIPSRQMTFNYFDGATDPYNTCNALADNILFVVSPKYNTPSNPYGLRFRFQNSTQTKFYYVYREHLGNAGTYYDYCVYFKEGDNRQATLYYVREYYQANTYYGSSVLDIITGAVAKHSVALEGVISFNTIGVQTLAYATKNGYTTGAPTTATNTLVLSYTSSFKNLIGVNAVDNTDSTIVKMIKLPYCPIVQTSGIGGLAYDSAMVYYDSSLKMIKMVQDFEFKAEITTDSGEMFDDTRFTFTPLDTDTRINEDTKLLHSAFSYWKFGYDEFYKIIAYEDLNLFNINATDIQAYFKMTKTLNSRFLFHLYSLDNYITYSQEDYDNIVSVARSNEATIYSNQYINYLRNGYNYDVKNKNRQLIFGALGVGMNALGMGVDLGNQAQSKAGLTALGGIGAAGGFIGGTLNFINNAISMEMQMEQKQQQLKSQATNVSGSDDIDLLEYYNKNKAYIFRYDLNQNMKDLLDDLFYYCGYACNRMGQPNISSRIWFNFIQADVVFQTSNIDKSFLQEIASKYAQGITFYHKRNNSYDLAQTKENWESDFFS